MLLWDRLGSLFWTKVSIIKFGLLPYEKRILFALVDGLHNTRFLNWLYYEYERRKALPIFENLRSTP